MAKIIGFIKDVYRMDLPNFFLGLAQWGVFLTFGLPLLFGIIVFFIGGFQDGGIFSFCGRINRKKYFIRIIAIFISILCSAIIIASTNSTFILIPVSLLFIGSFIYGLAIQAKRLHDINLSAWWIVPIFFVNAGTNNIFPDVIRTVCGLVNLAYTVLLFFKPGTVGINDYGIDPLTPTPPEVTPPACRADR